MGIDIGGTNTNIGIAGIENNLPVLLFSMNFNSLKIPSIEFAINEALTYAKNHYNIDISFGCIGAPGIVSSNHDFASLTNVSWNVDCRDIKKNTNLYDIFVLNDFQIIGYGINLLDSSNKNDLIYIKKGTSKQDVKSIKAIIGAGTGLGKTILVYEKNYDAYIPLPSEGGHADLPIYTNMESDLSTYIQKKQKTSYPVTYEQVLSGPGLLNIYQFLKETKYNNSNFQYSITSAEEISLYRNQEEVSKEAFQIFNRFYARCIKNFILDTMALGGIYIAGGIASKNLDLFYSDEFLHEIENTINRKELLQNVPIMLIKNYDVSLKGACFAANYKRNLENK
jgi:glucokinase